ncbi:MAG: chloramphenicol acetyltransferase [Pseudomonadota bacterium]
MPKLSVTEPLIQPGCEITNTEFGAYVSIASGTRLLNVKFGDYSYTDRYANIANTVVGKFSNIASFARIGPTDHPMHLATMHHFLYRSPDYWDDAEKWGEFWDWRESRITHIGHDTWIGHNAIIKPEVTVGIGAVVASGAVVTKDVEPFTIVGGVTASTIRDRYTDTVKQKMMDLAWWEWDHATLRERLEDFRQLKAEEFVAKYG